MLGFGFVVFLVVFGVGLLMNHSNPAVLGSVFAPVAAVLWGIFGPAPLPPSAATPKNATARSTPAVTPLRPHHPLLVGRGGHRGELADTLPTVQLAEGQPPLVREWGVAFVRAEILRGSGPFGEDGVDEREIFADFLVGTPVEGDAGELDRLMQVDGMLARADVVAVIRGGEADTVAGALADLRWRRDFYRDVRDDIDGL
jgi:hypothetical protein